uniref:Uncharacterized protein n=1 Tax=Setaria viridis TaxID=4556 RepID=A0A4U6SZB9_SETVI|nr:hypothetical protein SEVIR_9G232000v2 [Setaria viridis]
MGWARRSGILRRCRVGGGQSDLGRGLVPAGGGRAGGGGVSVRCPNRRGGDGEDGGGGKGGGACSGVGEGGGGGGGNDGTCAGGGDGGGGGGDGGTCPSGVDGDGGIGDGGVCSGGGDGGGGSGDGGACRGGDDGDGGDNGDGGVGVGGACPGGDDKDGGVGIDRKGLLCPRLEADLARLRDAANGEHVEHANLRDAIRIICEDLSVVQVEGTSTLAARVLGAYRRTCEIAREALHVGVMRAFGIFSSHYSSINFTAMSGGYASDYSEAELDKTDASVLNPAEALAKLLEDEAIPLEDPGTS